MTLGTSGRDHGTVDVVIGSDQLVLDLLDYLILMYVTIFVSVRFGNLIPMFCKIFENVFVLYRTTTLGSKKVSPFNPYYGRPFKQKPGQRTGNERQRNRR